MKSSLLLVCCVALLLGCADRRAWQKAGASEIELKQDHYACFQQARYFVAGVPASAQVQIGRPGGGFYGGMSRGFARGMSIGAARSGMAFDRGLYDACMEARGYK